MIAGEGEVAYGKLFHNKAGFVSKEWYPLFASYRRDGYDFDSRYEDGLASMKCKRIIDILTQYEALPSHEIKALAGFVKGEKGFESALNLLQMQTYITVRGFIRKRNKKGEEYGWPAAIYSLTEKFIGEEAIKEGYRIEPKEAKERIIKHLMEVYPAASYNEIELIIR
jgi:predicted transcriptional regulator